jgi:hypothetical protein
MGKMKEKLTEVWPTFIKETPQLPDFSVVEEPEKKLKLVQEAWELLAD